MAQLIAPDYGQQFLLPPALEDWVPEDHPARFLRAFVEELDLPVLGVSMPEGGEGRPAYAPSLLLKIWLYGYFHRIRSTRQLEVACREHLSLLWLTGLIQPDHNTLWRFWCQNRQPLRAVFKQTVAVAMRTGAVGVVLQALDGTRIEAAASSRGGWSLEAMKKLLAQLEAALDQTERAVEEQNAPVRASGYRLPATLAGREALREQIRAGLAQLAADGRTHYQPVEPEARRMKVGQTNRYAYNAQAVADAKEGVIVACEVTRQESDRGQLVPMIEQARQNLADAAPEAVTVADRGYGAGTDLAAAAAAGLRVLSPPAEGHPARDPAYAAEQFRYDPQQRSVTCPRGQRLDWEGRSTKHGRPVERYRCRVRDCPVRDQCTGDHHGRHVDVWEHTAEVQAMRQRLQEPGNRQLLQQRREIIERRFGQIKQHDGFRRWTVWGLEAVRTQWALLCATLNLRELYRRWRQQRPTPRNWPAAIFASA